MLPAILEKITFNVAAVLLYANGRATGSIAGGGTVDLVLGFCLRSLIGLRTTPVARGS